MNRNKILRAYVALELEKLKREIDDEMVDHEDQVPSLDVTLGTDGDDYFIQTGDNCQWGGAYHFRYWGVGRLYRDTNVKWLANDLIDQAFEQMEEI